MSPEIITIVVKYLDAEGKVVDKDSIMIARATRIRKEMLMQEPQEGKHLTFAFLERDLGMELEVVGWTKLKPQPDNPDYIKGTVNPWGCEIPVIDLRVMYCKGPTDMTDRTCIVIFEHSEQYRYYFGMVVEDLSNVINIADGTENKISSLLLSAKRHLSASCEVEN
jgi:chemotaxis signal transduction protein